MQKVCCRMIFGCFFSRVRQSAFKHSDGRSFGKVLMIFKLFFKLFFFYSQSFLFRHFNRDFQRKAVGGKKNKSIFTGNNFFHRHYHHFFKLLHTLFQCFIEPVFFFAYNAQYHFFLLQKFRIRFFVNIKNRFGDFD